MSTKHYTSFGRHAPLYIDKLQECLKDTATLKVLVALDACADRAGKNRG